jgi:hypothetical protein
MGFDLYGLKPDGAEQPEVDWDDEESRKKYWEWQNNNKGAYFRNNVWWWRPLWDYVCDVCSGILTEEQMGGGNSNDGIEISKPQAKSIADRLDELLLDGSVKKYEGEYKKCLEELPLEECSICKGTGVRDDEYVKGTCNGCSGKGKVESWATSYPFSEKNVQEFSVFCRHSGGFSIC